MNLKELSAEQKQMLMDSVNAFAEYEYGTHYDTVEDMVDEYNVLSIAYTTYGDNEEYEIQVNFNFDTMRYEEWLTQYFDDGSRERKLVSNESRTFEDFCYEMEGTSFEDMIRNCVDAIPDEYESFEESALGQLRGATCVNCYPCLDGFRYTVDVGFTNRDGQADETEFDVDSVQDLIDLWESQIDELEVAI